MSRGWGGIGQGVLLSVGPSVLITCLSLEAGPPQGVPTLHGEEGQWWVSRAWDLLGDRKSVV